MSYRGFTIEVARSEYGNFRVWKDDVYLCTCENEQDCKMFIDELCTVD